MLDCRQQSSNRVQRTKVTSIHNRPTSVNQPHQANQPSQQRATKTKTSIKRGAATAAALLIIYQGVIIAGPVVIHTHQKYAIMAKSENPIDVYRRKQRKKDLKKNKSIRIKARDAKVAATRSLDDVKTEISLLERKRDRNESKTGLDATEVKKLERLQKELRIVSAESIKRKALAEEAALQRDKELLAAQKTVAGVQKLNESKYTLVERYASVYYDEQLNPFGAPAPGQPKLYYADDGGTITTMDSRRAIVPIKWRKKFDLDRNKGKEEDEEGGSSSRAGKKRRWD
ncbi:hypothetical protein ACHAXR_010561, partial [Thalassiosira sp. AJA248-18]